PWLSPLAWPSVAAVTLRRVLGPLRRLDPRERVEGTRNSRRSKPGLISRRRPNDWHESAIHQRRALRPLERGAGVLFCGGSRDPHVSCAPPPCFRLYCEQFRLLIASQCKDGWAPRRLPRSRRALLTKPIDQIFDGRIGKPS